MNALFEAENYFGFIGLLLFAISWQLPDSRSILRLNALSFVFFSVDLFFKEAVTGSILIAAGALNAVVGSNLQKYRPSNAFLTLLVIVPLLAASLTFQTSIDLFPMIAHVTGSIAFFSGNLWRLRLLSPIGTLLWAVHNGAVGAHWQLLADFLILASMVIGACRNRK